MSGGEPDYLSPNLEMETLRASWLCPSSLPNTRYYKYGQIWDIKSLVGSPLGLLAWLWRQPVIIYTVMICTVTTVLMMMLPMTMTMPTMIMTTIGPAALRPQRLGPSFPFTTQLNSLQTDSTNDDDESFYFKFYSWPSLVWPNTRSLFLGPLWVKIDSDWCSRTAWAPSRDGRPAPPREKQAAPPRKKQALPRPAPWNWQNPRGAAGQNWLQIPLMAPFHYAYKLCIRGRKSRKIFSFDFVYRLWLSCSQKYLFNVKGYNVFLYQNIIKYFTYLNI